MTEEQEIRLECLRLAKAFGGTPQGIVEMAQAWADFTISGETGEIARITHEVAKKMRGSA